jgi:hypothetical protein
VSVLALEVSKAAETMQLTVLQTTKSRDAEMALRLHRVVLVASVAKLRKS